MMLILFVLSYSYQCLWEHPKLLQYFAPQFNLLYNANKILKMGPQKWAVDFNFTLFLQLASNACLYKSLNPQITLSKYSLKVLSVFFRGQTLKFLKKRW